MHWCLGGLVAAKREQGAKTRAGLCLLSIYHSLPINPQILLLAAPYASILSWRLHISLSVSWRELLTLIWRGFKTFLFLGLVNSNVLYLSACNLCSSCCNLQWKFRWGFKKQKKNIISYPKCRAPTLELGMLLYTQWDKSHRLPFILSCVPMQDLLTFFLARSDDLSHSPSPNYVSYSPINSVW